MERQIDRRRSLPGSRAVVGGLLMAVAAVGVFVAYTGATDRPTDPAVVAAATIRVGEVIEPDDLRVVDADLPGEVRDHSFGSLDAVVGRVALGPIADGELVQRGLVTDDVAGVALHEVAITLPRAQIAVGRLKQGERVDVFVTTDDTTRSVVRGSQVVQIGAADDGSLTSDREIELVVAVPSGDDVAAVVHALRTGDVTVVRSTLADAAVDDPLVYEGAADETTSTSEATAG
jgi:Flp pilus assembly protein CpaB